MYVCNPVVITDVNCNCKPSFDVSDIRGTMCMQFSCGKRHKTNTALSVCLIRAARAPKEERSLQV